MEKAEGSLWELLMVIYQWDKAKDLELDLVIPLEYLSAQLEPVKLSELLLLASPLVIR